VRLVEKHPTANAATFVADAAQVEKFGAWLTREIEDALSARNPQESVWRERLRGYEGVPKNPVRKVPVENAPNIEVTLGAIAVDSIYSQSLDLMFTVAPVLTARGANGTVDPKAVSGIQRLIDWGIKSEWALRPAAEHSVLDNVQLGTGAYYIPFVEHKKKTKTKKVTSRAPRILTHPIEDVLVPGGAHGDLQTERWCALRFWYTEGEMEDRRDAEKWNIEGVIPVGTIGWMRTRREQLGRTSSGTRVSELYETFRIWAYYDIDGDGFEEDLMCVWDRSSKKILLLGYNKYDYRPVEVSRYQLRAHLFYGVGVMDMIAPYQEETTEIHNHRVLNMLLANSRFWKAKAGAVPESMKIWPGKVQEMGSPEDVVGEAMADVYPSAPQAEAITISLAERRVGINDLSTPRPSAVLGSRTPGITALSMLQQVNKRFTAAFDGMRNTAAGAVRQCLYRYQERLLGGDKDVETHLSRVIGEDAQAVISIMRDPDFDEMVSIELTASSASVNRDADRQNSMMLVNILSQYYQRTLELVAIAANPQTPPAVRSVAQKIAESAGAIIERTIRTFDVIRDPSTFIIDTAEEMDSIEGLSQQGMLGLSQMMSGLFQQVGAGAGAGANGGPPALGPGPSDVPA